MHLYLFIVKYISSVHEFLRFLFVGLNFTSLFCKFLTILDFTHNCPKFVDVAIYALCPESFCVKNPAVRTVLVFSDSGLVTEDANNDYFLTGLDTHIVVE